MATSPRNGQTHECGHCGAPLPAPDAAGVRTCTFCKATFAPERPERRPAEPVRVQGLEVDVSAVAGTAAKGCGVATVLLVVVVLAIVAVPVVLAVRAATEAADPGVIRPGSSRFGDVLVALPGEPATMPSVVVADSRYEDGGTVQRLRRFDEGSTDPTWTTEPLPDTDASAPLLADTTHVYTAIGPVVLAFRSADGTAAWQAPLTDDYSVLSCSDCFTLVGDRLVVRTADGTLQAFDARSGAPAWSQRLADVNADVVAVAGLLAVRDGSGGDHTLTTIDPATGATVATLVPTCQRPGSTYTTELSTSSVVRARPGGDELVVALGTSPWCVQGWDPHTGAMRWNVAATEGVTFFDDSFTLVDSPAGLVVVARNTIGLVDPAHTAFRTLAEDRDTDVVPLGATAEALYVVAVNTRGTTKSSIRAIDLGSGQTRFDVPQGAAEPIDERQPLFAAFHASSEGTFSAHLADGRIYVLTFLRGSDYDHTLRTAVIDAATGAAEPARTIDAGSQALIPDFGPVRWDGGRALARAGEDTLQLIDVATGSVLHRIG